MVEFDQNLRVATHEIDAFNNGEGGFEANSPFIPEQLHRILDEKIRRLKGEIVTVVLGVVLVVILGLASGGCDLETGATGTKLPPTRTPLPTFTGTLELLRITPHPDKGLLATVTATAEEILVITPTPTSPY